MSNVGLSQRLPGSYSNSALLSAHHSSIDSLLNLFRRDRQTELTAKKTVKVKLKSKNVYKNFNTVTLLNMQV